MTKLGFKPIATSALAASLFIACGGTDKDPDGSGNGGNETAKQTAALSGRVDTAERAELKDGSVTAYKIESNGTLTKVSSAAEIGADGRYTITVDVTSGALDDVLVRAEKGTSRGDVLVTGRLAAAGKATAAPIDAETTAEAEIYVEARAKGIWSESANKILLREMVSREMAIELRSAMDHDAAVGTAARAMTAAVVAWDGMLRRDELGVADEQVKAFLDLHVAAQAKLDESLDAATTAELEAKAITDHGTAMEQAFDMAAIGFEQRAAAAQAAAVSMRVYLGQLAPATMARFVVAAEQMRAAMVTAGVEAQYAIVSDVETDRDAVVDAGVQLRATIDAAVTAGADAPQRIAAAWGEYHTAVRARMDKSLELAQRAALINVELALTGAQSTLRTSLGRVTATSSPVVTAAAVVNAYGTFAASVTAPAQITVLAAASVNLDRARALLEMMLILNASMEGTAAPIS